MYGPIIPGIVEAPLVIPINIPAYWGAISTWLTLNPGISIPLNPTAIVRKRTEPNSLELKYPTDNSPPAEINIPVIFLI